MTVVELRQYQQDGANAIREIFLADHRSVVYVSPTGSGKTVTFSYIARGASSRGNSVLILAHRDSLIKQASRKLSEYGVEHGIIMAGYTPKPHCLVQVGSVQTMIRRVRKYPHLFNFALIVIDEAHLSMANTYREIVDAFPNAKILGVTGTPCRLDGKGLGTHAGGYYDQMVVGTTVKDLIDMGYLVRPAVYAPEKQLDLSQVKKKGSDYDETQLAAVVDQPTITGSAVEHYQRICPGVPAIAWCVNLKHAEHVAEQFNAAGIRAVALKGEHSGVERDAAMAALESGEIKVVAFCQLLVEGVDCPAIKAVIMLRPTYSLTSYLQVIGRGLRPVYAFGYDLDDQRGRFDAIAAGPKGDRCYILDHAGLTFRHGFADEEREWSLDGVERRKGKKKKEGAAVKIVQCPNCFHVFEPAPICPSCRMEMPKRERHVEEVEGELKEITPEMMRDLQRNRRVEISKAKTFDELKALAEKYGYSDQWARIKWGFKERAREQFKQKRDAEWDSRFREYSDRH